MFIEKAKAAKKAKEKIFLREQIACAAKLAAQGAAGGLSADSAVQEALRMTVTTDNSNELSPLVLDIAEGEKRFHLQEVPEVTVRRTKTGKTRKAKDMKFVSHRDVNETMGFSAAASYNSIPSPGMY